MYENNFKSNGYNDSTVIPKAHVFEGAINEDAAKEVMTKVFLYMFGALALTAAAAYYAATSGMFEDIVRDKTYVFFIIAELVVVVAATAAMKKSNKVLSAILFAAYSIINGITLASIFYVYELGSITTVFISTAAVFGVMAVWGIVTKKDLTSIGSIGMMGLIGVLVASLLNLVIFKNSGFDLLVSIIGLAVFIGLTAYDAQKIKERASYDTASPATVIALYGALELYLDFINMFLRILRLFGKRSN